MASTNQSPFYKQAEVKYFLAQTDEDRIHWLEEMIKECPKHKSSEKMLANLKTRLIKLKESVERKQKTSKGGKKEGIKKGDLQIVIIGKTKSGKSSLLKQLTNTRPEIAEYPFTTKSPIIGSLYYATINMQIIENPAIESEYYDRGIVNSADILLLLITAIDEISGLQEKIGRAQGKRIIVFNKIDMLTENEKRKTLAQLSSKKYNFVLISSKTGEGIESLKEKIFQSFDKIRIYTKQPGKPAESNPIIMEKNATVKEAARKIFRGSTNLIKETHIWGPSSKFPGQIVGLNHILKDKDIVEFKTR